MGDIFLEGMLLQAGLILAVGPQNLFVLESGLKRHYHLTVSMVCFLCDLTLIMFGVAGAATFLHDYPQLKIIVGTLSVGFLVLYGISKLRSDDLSLIHFESDGKKKCFKAATISALTFSIANPHAYLDGIILIGGYSTKYSELGYRLTLGLGASFFSLIWFLLLSVGGSLIVPVLQSEKRMRFVMSCAGVLFLVMSVKLSLDVAGWVVEVYPETVAIGKRWVK